MFSSTTIALSTTIPTAKAIPARLMTFRVRPNANIMRMDPTMLIGMATAITMVLLILRRYMRSTMMARNPPIMMLCRTSEMALLMYSVSS
jgi:uncharacterized membrane protein